MQNTNRDPPGIPRIFHPYPRDFGIMGFFWKKRDLDFQNPETFGNGIPKKSHPEVTSGLWRVNIGSLSNPCCLTSHFCFTICELWKWNENEWASKLKCKKHGFPWTLWIFSHAWAPLWFYNLNLTAKACEFFYYGILIQEDHYIIRILLIYNLKSSNYTTNIQQKVFIF